MCTADSESRFVSSIYKFFTRLFTVSVFSLFALPANADSKILATSGATQLEGAAGGGIVPWAVIGGYGSDGEWGGAIASTRVSVDDFQLDVASALIGIHNRVELNIGHQDLHVEPLSLNIRQNIVGIKVRVAGDLIYHAMPQMSVGVLHKENRDPAVPNLLGAHDNSGYDLYFSASKVILAGWLERNWVVNGTLRWTNANQIGLLGFGNGNGDDYQLVAETSVGMFWNRHWAGGFEYRQKPDRLSAVTEDDWFDTWLGWFPNKRAAVVLAYADLGDIAGLVEQRGWYLSLQLSH